MKSQMQLKKTQNNYRESRIIDALDLQDRYRVYPRIVTLSVRVSEFWISMESYSG